MPRRSKGTGSLFKRGKIWYARWRYNGVEQTISTGKSSRVEAEEILLERTQPFRLRTEIAQRHEVQRQLDDLNSRLARAVDRVRDRVTLGDLADVYVKSPYRLDSSADQLDSLYLFSINELCNFFGSGVEVARMAAHEAEEFARSMDGKVSSNTYNKRISALREVWKATASVTGAVGNPWEMIRKKRADTQSRRVLTENEVRKILDGASGELRVLMTVGASTGMRLGDCAKLKWTAIHGKYIDVKTDKTGAQVSIPIHPELAKVLGKAKKGGYIMPGIAERYLRDKGSVSKDVLRVFRAAGIKTSEKQAGKLRARPLCGFHSFRHTFVSRAIAAGVEPHIVQAIVGHSDILMTQHYTHITDEQVLQSLEKAGDFMVTKKI